jgi:FtsP/CotA-like multicopper oxidase with cupredoxin domain
MHRMLLVHLLLVAVAAFTAAGFSGLRQRPVAAQPAFPEPVEVVSEGGVLRFTMTAARQEAVLAGQPFAATVYNGTLVGPTLRVRPGDRLELTLVNALEEPTNLHFHGLHVSPIGEADNVFREVAGGATARYVVDIPGDHPTGTFWYHAHQHHLAYEQVLGGLSGVFIIDGITALLPPELRDITQHTFAFRDFEVGSDPGAPSLRTVNGQINPALTLASGETQLWHRANIGPELFYELALPGMVFHVIAEDGSPVWQTWDAQTLVLPSGKRYDVLVQGGRAGNHAVAGAAVPPGLRELSGGHVGQGDGHRRRDSGIGASDAPDGSGRASASVGGGRRSPAHAGVLLRRRAGAVRHQRRAV